MAEDEEDRGAGSADSPRASRPLLRLLRRHAARIEAVHDAELDYHGVILTQLLRHKGKAKRASDKRMNEAFGKLTEAVVELQASQAAVLSLAAADGMTPETVCALDATFESATREYAGYLAARTYDQVYEVARADPLRGSH